MKEYHLEECIIRFLTSKNKTDLQRLVDEVTSFIYFNLNRFKIEQYSEDSRSDFIAYLYPRLPTIIERYDSARSSFRTYLYWITKTNWCSFLRNQLRDEAKHKVLQMQEEFEFSQDQTFNDLLLDIASQPQPKYGLTEKISKKKQEIHSRTIFLLACKACCYLDEKIIKRVIETTHYSEDYIRSTIDELRSSCSRKQEVIRIANERINSYYIRSIRSLYEMKYMNKDSRRYETLQKEYVFCIQRLNAARKTIQSHSKSPSNRALAIKLGISRGTIDATLASAHRGRYDC